VRIAPKANCERIRLGVAVEPTAGLVERSARDQDGFADLDQVRSSIETDLGRLGASRSRTSSAR